MDKNNFADEAFNVFSQLEKSEGSKDVNRCQAWKIAEIGTNCILTKNSAHKKQLLG